MHDAVRPQGAAALIACDPPVEADVDGAPVFADHGELDAVDFADLTESCKPFRKQRTLGRRKEIGKRPPDDLVARVSQQLEPSRVDLQKPAVDVQRLITQGCLLIEEFEVLLAAAQSLSGLLLAFSCADGGDQAGTHGCQRLEELDQLLVVTARTIRHTGHAHQFAAMIERKTEVTVDRRVPGRQAARPCVLIGPVGDDEPAARHRRACQVVEIDEQVVGRNELPMQLPRRIVPGNIGDRQATLERLPAFALKNLVQKPVLALGDIHENLQQSRKDRLGLPARNVQRLDVPDSAQKLVRPLQLVGDPRVCRNIGALHGESDHVVLLVDDRHDAVYHLPSAAPIDKAHRTAQAGRLIDAPLALLGNVGRQKLVHVAADQLLPGTSQSRGERLIALDNRPARIHEHHGLLDCIEHPLQVPPAFAQFFVLLPQPLPERFELPDEFDTGRVASCHRRALLAADRLMPERPGAACQRAHRLGRSPAARSVYRNHPLRRASDAKCALSIASPYAAMGCAVHAAGLERAIRGEDWRTSRLSGGQMADFCQGASIPMPLA